MDKLFTENKIPFFIAAVMSLQMLTVPFAVYPTLVNTGPTWLGIDDSWAMTLNDALLKNREWGEDIIYTYGPLGFLATRIGLGISRYFFLLFDIFITINFFFVF